MLQGTFLLLLCATAHGALPLQTALQTGEDVPAATETQPGVPTAREMLAAEQAAGVRSDDASPGSIEQPCDREPCSTESPPSTAESATQSATESTTPGPAELHATTHVETTGVPGTDAGTASAGPCGVPGCPDAAT